MILPIRVSSKESKVTFILRNFSNINPNGLNNMTSAGISNTTNSLRNSGAMYVSNNMPRRYQNFSVCLGNMSEKKLARTQQKLLYITSAMASAYPGMGRACGLFTYNKLERVKRKIIFLSLITLFWFLHLSFL